MDHAATYLESLKLYGGTPDASAQFYMPIDCIALDETKKVYIAPIIGTIGGIQNYLGLLSVLDNARETDVVKIILDTPGGRVDTACMIANAIKRCKATVIGVANGQVMSAASTFIFPACKNWEIRSCSTFMFHGSSQTQQGGKTLLIRDFAVLVVEFMTAQLNQLLAMGMLTQSEMDDLINKKSTIFVSGDDIRSRMKEKGLVVS